MTPAQARAFHAVAVEGSFTAAAHFLNVSQPTLTNQVRLIESRYQVELFHRTSRGVRLTEAGAHLLSIVRRMIGGYEEAVQFLEEVHGIAKGHLRIGSYEPRELASMIAPFVQKYPGIQVSVRIANSPELSDLLAGYGIDVAVLSGAERRSEFLTMPLRTPRLIVIAPRTDEWIKRTSIKPAELAGHTLIVREQGSEARRAFERLLLEAGVSLANFYEFETRDGVTSAVAAGIGLSAVFDDGLHNEENIVRLTIKGCNMKSVIDVACLRERRNSAAIRTFLKVAESQIDIKSGD